jgi:iron(III) transport system permease protein
VSNPQHQQPSAIGVPPSPTAGPSSAPARAWRYVGGGRGFVWLSLAVATLFVLPVLAVVVNIFVPSGGAWSHLAGTVLPRYIANTLWLVLGVGLGVPVIGAGTAWLVTMCRFPGRRVFEWALILPLAVPAYVMAYTYTDFLQFTGPVQGLLRELMGWGAGDYHFPEIRSLGGAIVMLIFVLFPYTYLLCRAAFLEQSVCALEVSRTLGCGPFGSFFRVALPLARPAIAAGTTLALMETLADYGTVSFFGVPTFTTGVIKAWIGLGDRVTAAQLASALLSLVFLVLVLERWSRGRARYHHTSMRYQRLPDYHLPGWRGALASVACATPLVIGFLLPAAILLKMTLEAGDQQFGTRFFTLAVNSFSLAGLTALLAAVLACLMAYGARVRPGRLTGLANRTVALGYAIPGAVVAVGTLLPLAFFDNAIDGFMRETFGLSTGLLFTGTIFALVYAYLVRFLAVSLNTVEASLTKVRPSMDDAARSLGHGPAATLVRVHVPLMWAGLSTACLLVFVDVMKELPATLVMRPFNFDTLAVRAFNLASDERLSEAATASLVIVAVGILPLILLSRTIARARPGANLPQASPAEAG